MIIAVCDNDTLHLESISNKIDIFFDGTAEIHSFDNDITLIDEIRAGLKPNILVTDIELDDNRNGIDTAKAINRLLSNCKIIFLTGYSEYISNAYETEHTYYVLKSTVNENLPKALQKATESIINEIKTIYVENKFEKVLIDTAAIKYIERDRRTSRIVCDDNVYTTSQKLNELLEALDSLCFVRCHNSFVINFQQVKSFKQSTFTLKTGEEITVSRTYKASVENAFLAYIKAKTVSGGKAL